MLTLRYVTLNMGHVTLTLRYVTLNMGYVTLNMGYVTLNMGYVTLNMGHVTLTMSHVTFTFDMSRFLDDQVGFIVGRHYWNCGCTAAWRVSLAAELAIGVDLRAIGPDRLPKRESSWVHNSLSTLQYMVKAVGWFRERSPAIGYGALHRSLPCRSTQPRTTQLLNTHRHPEIFTMDKQRIQADLDLINTLLNCASNEQRTEILQANIHSIDLELVHVMEVVAVQMEQKENRKASEWLESLAMELAEAINFWYELNQKAIKFYHHGKYVEAVNYAEQALDVARKLWGEKHPSVATSLNHLAELYQSQGRFSEAEPLYIEALQIRKRLLGDAHPDVATNLNHLAELYRSQGRFTEAEPLYIEALQMRKRLLGDAHPDVASSLNNLAALYRNQGRLTEAEPLYIEALQMRKRLLGDAHPDVASSLNNLAALYRNQGRLTEAEPLLIKALQMRKILLGEAHPDVATSLHHLAALYSSQGRLTEAEDLYIEALQMRKRLLGDAHPDVATNLNNLAELYQSQGRLTEAEPFYNEALQMRKRLLGDAHPDVAASLNHLAELYQSQGRLTEAEPFYNEALQMRKRLLGDAHPDVAASLHHLAGLLVLTGSPAEALARMTEATEVEDNILRRTFAFSSEKDRLTYIQSMRKNFEAFLSLVLNYLQGSPEAVQAALDLVLRRKALSASALAAQNQALYSGHYPHLTAEFKQLRRLSEEIVHLTFAIPEADELSSIKETLQQKQIEYDNLQRQLAKQVPEIKLQEQARDRRAVALELPEGSRLVEFVCTRIFDFTAPRGKEWKPARYLAFILPAQQPDAVQLIDLGEAEHINRLIQVFRDVASLQSDSPFSVLLSDSKESPAINRGNRLEMWDTDSFSECPILEYDLPAEVLQLREALFDKISPYLKNSKHLILAPDGRLNLVPFQLLPLEGEKMLMDSYSISYLSVGRDILRTKISAPRPASPPVVIADPDFDWKPSGWVEPSETQQPVNNVNVGFRSSTLPTTLAGTIFNRAPGTRFLGESVAKMLGIKPYLDREALLSHITTDNCPSILLIATHGVMIQENGKERQSYVDLVTLLLKCPTEREENIILQNYSWLLDNELVREIENLATILDDIRYHKIANNLRNIAAKLDVKYRYTKLQDNRLSAPVENPMLRSGLALAGANTWLSGGKLPIEAGKGFLFAQEVAGLDLWANELTVLSACQTGMGDIQLGEGVFGLRRAFAIAGTRTLIMSLWSVPDRVTALLMERMFADLEKGKGRGEALQSAQNYIRRITVGELRQSELGLEVLKEQMGVVELKSDTKLPWDDEVRLLEHPYYWGAWICQGETKPMVTGE